MILVMGVSGCGKTTVATNLAMRLGWPFVEGDALHPPENIAKMQAGIALDDCDRAPWLERVAGQIRAWLESGSPGVITCSALKRAYRRILVSQPAAMRLVYLKGEKQQLVARMTARTGHFMPASLLDSQLAILEPPGPEERPIIVPISQPLTRTLTQIEAALR